MASKNIKSPLVINIFWHNSDTYMHDLGNLCYNFFLRNDQNPLDRHLGIQTYMFPYIPEVSDLNLEHAQNSANILLVDNHMKLSSEWKKFAKILKDEIVMTKTGNHQIFPVAIHSNGIRFSKELAVRHYLRLFDIAESRKENYFLINIAHSICGMLYHKVLPKSNQGVPNSPVKLFLSHAKKDGKIIAEKLWKHILNIPNVDSFFDANDIADGYSFEAQINQHVGQSILVVIHTDIYSTREWCRKEVIIAKKKNVPVIVVNQFNKGELRSFPYIGNVPHIKYTEGCNDDNSEMKSFDYIVLEAMREVLKIRYNSLKMDEMLSTFGVNVKKSLNYPPELLTLTQLMDTKKGLILYPDPPLGLEELEILKTFRKDLNFITPTSLPLYSKGKLAPGNYNSKNIAISLSETDISEIAWIENRAIQDLMVMITRYLLVIGANLIYSGDLFYKPKKDGFNFVELLIELVKTYKIDFQDSNTKPIQNFSAFPYYHSISTDQRADLSDLVDFISVDAPQNLKVSKKDVESIAEFDTYSKKYVFAKSLTAMRRKMMASSNALIVLGGKTKNFRGRMPGILEETIIAFEHNIPIYIIGSFGGVAQGIVEALRGGKPNIFDSTFYENYYPNYNEFLPKYNDHYLTEESEKVEYDKIVDALNKMGATSRDFGLNNGLDKLENERLFDSKNEIEILSLILKGIRKV